MCGVDTDRQSDTQTDTLNMMLSLISGRYAIPDTPRTAYVYVCVSGGGGGTAQCKYNMLP